MSVKIDFDAKKIERQMSKHIEAGMEAIEGVLEREIKIRLSTEGTGILYPPAKSGKNKGYPKSRRSAPGNPPTVQHGRLRNSWSKAVKSKPKKVKGLGYVSSVRQTMNIGAGTPVKYGWILEDPDNTRPYKYRRKYLGGDDGAIAITQRKAQRVFSKFFKDSIIAAGGRT